MYPGAQPAELPEGPNSGAWLWARTSRRSRRGTATRLESAGFTIDNLSSPLEDGTRVLDVDSDLPECRIQTTFRPENGSTMIVGDVRCRLRRRRRLTEGGTGADGTEAGRRIGAGLLALVLVVLVVLLVLAAL